MLPSTSCSGVCQHGNRHPPTHPRAGAEREGEEKARVWQQAHARDSEVHPVSSSSCQKYAGNTMLGLWSGWCGSSGRPPTSLTVGVLFGWGGGPGSFSAFPLRMNVTERCKWKVYE